MDIIKKNRLDLSDFKFKFNWNEKELEGFFPDIEKEHMVPKLIIEENKIARIFSLFFIFLLLVLLLAFVPLPPAINDLVDIYHGTELFTVSLFVSGSLTWLGIRFYNRYRIKVKLINKEDSKTSNKVRMLTLIRSFSISDLIPLILISGILFVYNEKKNPEINSFYDNPIVYILKNAPINHSNYNSSIIPILLQIFTLIMISGICIAIVHYVWVYNPSKLFDLVKYGVDKNVTAEYVVGNQYKRFIIDKVPGNRFPRLRSENKHYKSRILKTVSPDVNINRLWRLINPRYEITFLWRFLLGLFLLILGLIYLDPLIYEFQTGQDSTMGLSMGLPCVLSECFGFFLLYYAVTPLWNYYKLKKFMINEIAKKIDSLYQTLDPQIQKVSDLQELLFLRDCLDEKKNAPFLPFNKAFLSGLLLLPFIGQVFNLLLD